MRLVVFGAGYVGLVTGTGLAELGHEVLTVDTDASKITKLEDGIIPIHEPALADFFKPDRIVVGAKSDTARSMLRELYAPLQLSGERMVMTDPRSSELIKYAANTMLAMRVSFMNELSRLCHITGANIHAVRM